MQTSVAVLKNCRNCLTGQVRYDTGLKTRRSKTTLSRATSYTDQEPCLETSKYSITFSLSSIQDLTLTQRNLEFI